MANDEVLELKRQMQNLEHELLRQVQRNRAIEEVCGVLERERDRLLGLQHRTKALLQKCLSEHEK